MSGVFHIGNLYIVLNPELAINEQTISKKIKERKAILDKLQPGSIVIISHYLAMYDDIFYGNDREKYNKSICKYQGHTCTNLSKSNNFNDIAIKEFSKIIEQYKHLKFVIIGENFISSEYRNYAIFASLNSPLSLLYKSFVAKLLTNANVNEETLAKTSRQKFTQINNALKKLEYKHKNVKVIDPNMALCNNGSCRLYDNNHWPLFRDDNHLTVKGADVVIKILYKELQSNRFL